MCMYINIQETCSALTGLSVAIFRPLLAVSMSLNQSGLFKICAFTEIYLERIKFLAFYHQLMFLKVVKCAVFHFKYST